MFPGIQQPIFPKEQISSLIPIVCATKPSPLVSRARKLARKYKWLISEIFRPNPLIFRAPSPCFLCTCMWIHGCKYLGTHVCGNQSRMVAAVLLPSTLLPWDRVPRWKGSPLVLPGCLVGHLALRSAWLYPSSNLGGFSNLEIWIWALTLAEWVFLLTQPSHQLSFFFMWYFYYKIILCSSWMLFSVLASAQLLCFSLPVGLFCFFAYFFSSTSPAHLLILIFTRISLVLMGCMFWRL